MDTSPKPIRVSRDAASPVHPADLLLTDPARARIEFGRRLWAGGLGRRAAELVGLGRDAVRLHSHPPAAGEAPASRSRLGGEPDLPDDMAWPTYKRTPQSFIAQIDLAEIHRHLPDAPLPHDGSLLFFCDSEQRIWGYNAEAGASSVVHVAGDQPVSRRATPLRVADRGRFHERWLVPQRELTYPSWLGDEVERIADDLDQLDDFDDVEAYADLLASVPRGDTLHRMLGHCAPIQHDMDQTGWTLLLQVDSDRGAGMTWGDSGILYWWIRDDDLAARRWERSRLIMQCC